METLSLRAKLSPELREAKFRASGGKLTTRIKGRDATNLPAPCNSTEIKNRVNFLRWHRGAPFTPKGLATEAPFAPSPRNP
ncbi:hypothetical protein MTP99_009815 [Tenebrio molitor]|nr:hypothetical protein MTP99_009815 [Tenebrio molitor]